MDWAPVSGANIHEGGRGVGHLGRGGADTPLHSMGSIGDLNVML